MSNTNLDQLVNQYIEAWSTTNSDKREKLVEIVYSKSAEFYANEPGDKAVEHHGLESIKRNITQVNDKLVVGNGLRTESIGFSENHGMIRITWQMKTPNEEVALKGMNFLILNDSGKIKKDYIFLN